MSVFMGGDHGMVDRDQETCDRGLGMASGGEGRGQGFVFDINKVLV